MLLRSGFLLIAGLTLAMCVYGQSYKVTGTIPLGGEGGWDYLIVEPGGRRLFVTHNAEVVVVDLETNKRVEAITGLGGTHGVAFAPEFDRGFISDGRNNEVVSFDLKTLAVRQKIKAGTNPDGIVYDPYSKRVFAFNGRSKDATAIDAESEKVAGVIPLSGKPEFPVTDNEGSVYVNIEDTGSIAKIDPKQLKVEATWPIKPCESPSGLAFDSKGKKLFSVCDNDMMAVVDMSGHVVATPKIGGGPDAAAWDPELKLAFSSDGEDGTVTVVKQSGATYEPAATVTTMKGARTMALDPQTHRIYLSVADRGPAAAAGQRPTPKPGTFRLLVLSPSGN